MEENQRALTISEWRQVMKIQNDEPVSVNIEVPAYRLRNAEQILAQLGLNPNQAINLFLAKVKLCQGLPQGQFILSIFAHYFTNLTNNPGQSILLAV